MPRKRRPSGPRSTPESDEPLFQGQPAPAGERLQKVLAAAGLGSRRECEELITAGRVDVDGKVVTELGVRVDTATQQIRVDGEKINSTRRQYYLVNKPVGVVCTNHDPSGRMRVIDLVPTAARLFSIGRLDRNSEGLILLTNDGEFANRVAHPRYGVSKTYRVLVAGKPTAEQLQQLLRGVHLAEGLARATSVFVKKSRGDSTELEIVLNEGRNREIRRVLARIGHKVMRLKRISIGPIRLGDLEPGAYRRLSLHEVRALNLAAEKSAQQGRRAAQAARSSGHARSTARSARQDERTRRPLPGRLRPAKLPPAKLPPAKLPPAKQGAVLDFESEEPVVQPGGAKRPPRPRRDQVQQRAARAAARRPARGKPGKPAKRRRSKGQG